MKRTSLFLIPLLSFIVLPLFEPLLHDHEIDGEDHHNCPVYKWLQDANALVSVFVFLLYLTFFTLLCLLTGTAAAVWSSRLRRIRSPPAEPSL